MPRKGHIQKEMYWQIPCTTVRWLPKLINNIMLDGKKGVAQKKIYWYYGSWLISMPVKRH